MARPWDGTEVQELLEEGEPPEPWDDIIDLLDLLGGGRQLALFLHTPRREHRDRREIERRIRDRYGFPSMNASTLCKQFKAMEEQGLVAARQKENPATGIDRTAARMTETGRVYYGLIVSSLETAARHDSLQETLAFWRNQPQDDRKALYLGVLASLDDAGEATSSDIGDVFEETHDNPTTQARRRLHTLGEYGFVQKRDGDGRQNIYFLSDSGAAFVAQVDLSYRVLASDSDLSPDALPLDPAAYRPPPGTDIEAYIQRTVPDGDGRDGRGGRPPKHLDL